MTTNRYARLKRGLSIVDGELYGIENTKLECDRMGWMDMHG
jgi:hypothetical protein